MIAGYDEGTEVKWNNADGGFSTGIIVARYYEPGRYELHGYEFDIENIGNSPVYAIEPDNPEDEGRIIILPHTLVFREHMNPHT
jgi:hypothetical protein